MRTTAAPRAETRVALATRAISTTINERLAIAIAAALGLGFFLCAFPIDFLLGRGDYWSYPAGDAGMQLLGYRYFVKDAWHFPLLKTVLIDPPTGINILHLDSIPLVALVGKILSPILGTTFVPYGLWMLSCYVLQAVFATRLVRILGHRTALAAVIASVFAITFHSFLGRYYHQGLNAHFLILWAFCLYFAGAIDAKDRARRFSWLALLVVALLVHPYLLVMTFLIFVAACIHQGRLRWRARSLSFCAMTLALVGIALITGHISGAVLAGRAEGFGMCSLNLGSLVLPLPERSALFRTPGLLLEATGEQWDGNMFLGFGVLVLFGIHLARSWRFITHGFRAHVALATALLLMFFFALSNRVYLFHWLLLRYEIPRPLQWLAAQFRATGRFAWPCGFFLALMMIPLTLRRFALYIAAPLLLFCAALEVYDAGSYLRIIRENSTRAFPRELSWAALRPAIAVHERVEQWPSFQCMDNLIEQLEAPSRELQFLAAMEGRPINGVRAGRLVKDCTEERKSWHPYETGIGAIAFYVRATSPTARPPQCRPIGPWVICSDRWNRPELAGLRAMAAGDAPPGYVFGQTLDFGATKTVTPYLDGEWLVAEYERILLGRTPARLRMRVQPSVVGRKLAIEGGASFDKASTIQLEASINGAPVATWQITNQQTSRWSSPIPPAILSAGSVEIVFSIAASDASTFAFSKAWIE